MVLDGFTWNRQTHTQTHARTLTDTFTTKAHVVHMGAQNGRRTSPEYSLSPHKFGPDRLRDVEEKCIQAELRGQHIKNLYGETLGSKNNFEVTCI